MGVFFVQLMLLSIFNAFKSHLLRKHILLAQSIIIFRINKHPRPHSKKL